MKNTGVFVTVLLHLLSAAAWAGDGHEEHHEHGGSAAIVLSESTLRERGLVTAVAGPAQLAKTLRVYGRVGANQDRLAHIHPRFPGVIVDVRKDIGAFVNKGEPLAVIESNQSLQPYKVVSLISGTVLFRHATLGEFVSEDDPIFIVTDLTSLWVDLFIFPRDFGLVKEGLRVRIKPPDSNERLESTTTFVSQVADERTQARVARVVIDGERQRLYLDQSVDADIILDSVNVPIAVLTSAIQRVDDRSVVFVKAGEGYEVQEVLTGRSDGETIEILSGLRQGAAYAAGNTFLLKAELGKESAEHEH